MENNINRILSTITSEMLEGLAFIFALPAESIDDIDTESLLAAKVSFTGPFDGTLIVMVSQQMLPELAANMLGMDMDNDVSMDEQYDALRELLNVICGNLLPQLAGSQEIFSIEVPEIIDKEVITAFTQGRSLSGATKLELDDGYISLMLYTDGDISVPADN